MNNAPIFSNSQKQAGISWGKVGLIAGSILLVLAVLVVRLAFVSIRPDERGVVLSMLQPMGLRSDVLQPGPHWILPIVEVPRIYSVAPQTYSVSSSSNSGDDPILVRTRDNQDFKISLTMIYSIDPEKVIELHIIWQKRYQDDFVRPLVRAFVRDIASKYTAGEIMGSAKKDIEQTALEHLASEFADNDLILMDFKITEVAR